MRLSKLQKYILERCLEKSNLTESKTELYRFYPPDERAANRKTIQDTVHASIAGLVDKNLAVAYGRKTKEKWFTSRVKLTPRGRKQAREILAARQRKLPIK